MKRPLDDDYEEEQDDRKRRRGDGPKVELRFLLASKVGQAQEWLTLSFACMDFYWLFLGVRFDIV